MASSTKQLSGFNRAKLGQTLKVRIIPEDGKREVADVVKDINVAGVPVRQTIPQLQLLEL